MELTATTMISLDGVTQAPGGPEEDTSGGFDLGGWSMPYIDDDGARFVRENFARADAFLLGRRTYEIFAAYWPQIDSQNPIAAALNDRPKHVVSSTLRDLSWEGASLLDGELVEGVAELKRTPGRELQVHGSVRLCQSLLAAGLVDRHHLLVFPVALRGGARLFDGALPPMKFRLERASATGAGVQLLTYVPDGAPRQGSFEDTAEPESGPIIR
ncbi:MAG TPA: dihydrofolate reductase family protein [Solirubrobacterales bacterium]|jgi:dihydrofolate reductase|nr:dihydrofolate reductase family protein [Solirubrobacterales bacterium]